MTRKKVSTAKKSPRKYKLRQPNLEPTSPENTARLMQINLEEMQKTGCTQLAEVAYLMTEIPALIVSNMVKRLGMDPIAFREPFIHGMERAWDAAVANMTAKDVATKSASTESENK